MLLRNKKAIVTGANRGIGQQIAFSLAQQGADICFSYKGDEAEAIKTAEHINALGRKVFFFETDFGNIENIKSFSKNAIDCLKHIDILVNNAGIYCGDRLIEFNPREMINLLTINTVAPIYLSQLISNHMIQNHINGNIVNISSIAGIKTFPKGITYAASKSAINKITQNSALDLAPYGIRVNAIAPGVIETGMNENTAREHPEYWETHKKNIPLARYGTTEDISNAVLNILSDSASWITGKILEVDGGHVL